KFTRQLEKTFGPLSKTLLFEHQTLDALAGYFAAAHPGLFVREDGGEAPAPLMADHQEGEKSTPTPAPVASPTPPGEPGPIAIIGISGRFPMAPDLDTFWENLKAGRDGVTPRPPERGGEPFPREGTLWGGYLEEADRFDPLFF